MNIADQPFGIGRGLAAVVARTHSNLFLRYAIECNTEWLHRRSQGSTFLAIGSDELRKLPIRVAKERAHCEAAVNIISNLDSQIEATEALIAKQERVRAGLLQDLFTRGVDEQATLRAPREEAPHLYHETELGWLPKDWSTITLEHLVDKSRPISYGILMPGHHIPEGVPVIKVRDIIDGEIVQQGLLRTSRKIDSEYARSRLRGGDLLITIRGTVGRLALVPVELTGANITQDTARLAIPTKSPHFFMYYLLSDIATRYLQANTLGNAVQGINLRDVKRMHVPKASNSEQAAVVSILTSHRAFFQHLKSELIKLTLLKSGLMQDLLTGRVPVEALLESELA